MKRSRKILTQDEINAILFADTDESDIDLEDEDDGWRESSMIENANGENVFQNLMIDEEEIDENSSLNSSYGIDEDAKISWRETVKNEEITPHIFSSFAGPVHDLPVGSMPLQFLRLFFTNEVMENIRINTNKYAEFCEKKRGRKDLSWIPV